MEVYNVAVKSGVIFSSGGFSNITNGIFYSALKETACMGVLVFAFSSLWGNRLGAAVSSKYVDFSKDNPFVCRIVRQACTVGVMCPTMSLAATVLFTILLSNGSWTQLPAAWIGTVIKNFPMAFLWNMYAASPFTHWLFGMIFERNTNRVH